MSLPRKGGEGGGERRRGRDVEKKKTGKKKYKCNGGEREGG